mmetsp:Transcript_30738/g.67895  ORF Transcript_30738/g.67895 Transcript_30738/m.67895 type:complete len:278 (-) Transcript_30738:392-1225(-)
MRLPVLPAHGARLGGEVSAVLLQRVYGGEQVRVLAGLAERVGERAVQGAVEAQQVGQLSPPRERVLLYHIPQRGADHRQRRAHAHTVSESPLPGLAAHQHAVQHAPHRGQLDRSSGGARQLYARGRPLWPPVLSLLRLLQGAPESRELHCEAVGGIGGPEPVKEVVEHGGDAQVQVEGSHPAVVFVLHMQQHGALLGVHVHDGLQHGQPVAHVGAQEEAGDVGDGEENLEVPDYRIVPPFEDDFVRKSLGDGGGEGVAGGYEGLVGGLLLGVAQLPL